MPLSFPEQFSNYAITIDFDWAPDFTIDFTISLLLKYRVKATFFTTHQTDLHDKIRQHDHLFELGIHPNFMTGTTQGKNYREVMSNLIKMVPEAQSVRTHGLYQSSNLMKMLCCEFNMKNDISIFQWNTSFQLPSALHYGTKNLIRLSYMWAEEEEMACEEPFQLKGRYTKWSGMRVFNFHPIHIYLNSNNTKSYIDLKSKVQLSTCKESEVKPFINQNIGTRNFFVDLLERAQNGEQFYTVSEIGNEFKQSGL